MNKNIIPKGYRRLRVGERWPRQLFCKALLNGGKPLLINNETWYEYTYHDFDLLNLYGFVSKDTHDRFIDIIKK